MSATPPGPPSRSTPNGQPHLVRRKPAVIDPLVQRKKPPTYRPPPIKRPPAQTNGRLGPTTNGAPRAPISHPSPQNPLQNVQVREQANDVSGFSDSTLNNNPAGYQDFKLVTTKRQLLEGLRHHVMNLTGAQDLDLQNEDQFTRPVRLHRRDPRAPPLGILKEEADEPPPNDMDKIEREAYLKRKEERQKEREANLAQIAPSAETGKKLKHFTRKTEQVFRPGQSEELRQKAQDKYEEKLPWHLEDFNEKHCLVGSNQATMSYQHAALVLEADPTGQSAGKCRIVPVQKWYRFAQKPKLEKFANLTIEEAEKQMKQLQKDPEWLLQHRMESIKAREVEKMSKSSRRLFTALSSNDKGRAEDESGDLDYDDDFADDEDNTLEFGEKDEDTKLAEKKIKQEQLAANFFDKNDEKDVDKQEMKEQRLKEAQAQFSRKINKSLRRREGNFNMGSDSDEDPFASSDSESEAEENPEKNKEDKGSISAAEGKSGASSRGTNTPSNRKEKHGNPGSDRETISRKGSLLKRPRSPNLSDAGSGTDASTRRKKERQLLKPPSSTGTSTPVTGSRPSSNLPTDPNSKKRKSLALGMRGAGGAGSDSEGAGGVLSDGATSDGGKAKRLKLNPPGTISPPNGGSRAGSPQPSSNAEVSLPTPAEIAAYIPSKGISAKVLYNHFSSRVTDNTRTQFWNNLKRVSVYNKEERVITLKQSKGAGGGQQQQQQQQQQGKATGQTPPAQNDSS